MQDTLITNAAVMIILLALLSWFEWLSFSTATITILLYALVTMREHILFTKNDNRRQGG